MKKIFKTGFFVIVGFFLLATATQNVYRFASDVGLINGSATYPSLNFFEATKGATGLYYDGTSAGGICFATAQTKRACIKDPAVTNGYGRLYINGLSQYYTNTAAKAALGGVAGEVYICRTSDGGTDQLCITK